MSLIDSRIPAALDEDGMSPDEKQQYEMLRAHRVLGLLIQRIPLSTPMWRWAICSDGSHAIEGTLAVTASGHESRAHLMALAEQLGLDYSEKPHINGKNIVSAVGVYAGVRVKLLDLVKPCACEGCEVPR